MFFTHGFSSFGTAVELTCVQAVYVIGVSFGKIRIGIGTAAGMNEYCIMGIGNIYIVVAGRADRANLGDFFKIVIYLYIGG